MIPRVASSRNDSDVIIERPNMRAPIALLILHPLLMDMVEAIAGTDRRGRLYHRHSVTDSRCTVMTEMDATTTEGTAPNTIRR